MKNDKSQFAVRTSDFHLSSFICHLSFVRKKSLPGCVGAQASCSPRRHEDAKSRKGFLRVFVVRFFGVAHLHTANATRRQSKVRFCSRRRAQRPCNIPPASDS